MTRVGDAGFDNPVSPAAFPSRAALSISATLGRSPAGVATAAGAAFPATGLAALGFSLAGAAPPFPDCARAAARISLVDLGPPAAAAAPPDWARAAARISFVDFGAPPTAGAGFSDEGLAAAAGAGAAPPV